MSRQDNIEMALDKFGKSVIKQARSNLTRKNRNVSSKLYNSLDYKVDVSKKGTSFSFAFEMEDYGEYLDKGVKGKSSSAKAPDSPYRFGTGSGRKGGLRDSIPEWVRKKRFQFQDRKTGKFLSYESTAFLIARSIYQTGLKTTNFFTRPFNLAFNKLPIEITKAFALTQEEFKKFTEK